MKKLYEPVGVSDNKLYTDGNEYMFKNGEAYVGYYNKQSNGNVYTGVSYSKKSKKLYDYSELLKNKNIFIYDSVKEYDFKKNFVLVYKEFSPSIEDYDTGYINRYFCKKNKSEYIIEIDEKQYNKLISNNYSSSYIYRVVEMQWKLSGDMFDIFDGNVRISNGVYDSNKRSIQNANKKLYGLINYIKSYVEKTIFSEYYKKLINDNK